MAFVWASPALARESKLEQLAEYGNGQQMKQYLMKNKRFPQSELDKALFASIDNRDHNVLRILLAAGADPNASPDNSELEKAGVAGDECAWYSPLENAFANELYRPSSQRDWTKAMILMQAGAYAPGILNNKPSSHTIVEYGNDYVVELFLKTHKIDKQERDYDGMTIYDCAKKNKQLSARVRNMLR